MSDKVSIQYQCTHISCRRPKCYQGKLELEKEVFSKLKGSEKDPNLMRCPSKMCIINASPQLTIVKIDSIDSEPITTQSQAIEAYKAKKLLERKREELKGQIIITQVELEKIDNDIKSLDQKITQLQATKDSQ